MNAQFNKSTRNKLLSGLAVVLLVFLAVLFWKTHTVNSAVVTEGQAKTEKQQPAEPAKVVLRSSLAGRWYSADTETLKKQIEGFFTKADVKPIDNIIALILPHAGYQYSGQTAACALKVINRKYKRVVVIGPTHYMPMEEMLSVPRATHYETPLGQVPLDTEFIDKLLKYPMFANLPRAHKYEHSVQIEIPLLQHVQQDFMLVPIVAGRCSLETINKVSSILKGLVDAETLVIASSDFVHYGTNFGYVPFKENVPEKIKDLDMGAYEHISQLDEEGFLKYKYKTGATICGYVPVAILLSMMDEGTKAKLIKYTTSGELTGDFTNSVSYLSVAFRGKWQTRVEVNPQTSGGNLTEEDTKQLLALARKSIIYFLENKKAPQVSELAIAISEAMKQPRAAFVTLERQSLLRGCIGDILPQRPLYKSIIANAINAAVNDRRFPPVTIAECNDITIEISALTVPEPVGSPNDIRVGVDGVVLNKDGRSAVFLPQVAPQQGWDLNQMLTQLSLKARLPDDAWKEGADFLVFQAVVFGEEER